MRKKTLSEILGENVRKYRKDFGMNQEDVAEAIGLTRVSIVNIEQGRQSPAYEKLMLICALFSCTPNDLLPQVGIAKPMKSVLHVQFNSKAAEKRFHQDPEAVKMLNKMVTKAYYMKPKKKKK